MAADGGVFNYGDAKFSGSTGNIKLNQPIVGMATARLTLTADARPLACRPAGRGRLAVDLIRRQNWPLCQTP